MNAETEFNAGVYCIINLINKKKYAGSSSTSIKNRWAHHRSLLRSGRHGNYRLQRDWDKYGEENFDFRVLIYTEPEEALPLEQWILDNYTYLFEYNIAKNATASFLGLKHSKETKQKISKARMGTHHSDETKKKISESQNGHPVSNETKRKISKAHMGENNPNFGKHHTEETRQKMSKANSSDKNYKWIDIPEEKINEMKSLRAQGYTYEKIAGIFGVSSPVVWRRLHNYMNN